MKNIFIKKLSILSVLFMALLSSSCEDSLDAVAVQDNKLTLSVSSSELVLQEVKQNDSFTFKWTTGTNNGTGASISYKLQLDKAGANFANAVEYDLGVNKFTQALSIKNLNFILVNTFGITPGTAQKFEAKIIATVAGSESAKQEATVEFTLTPYAAVSSSLYIVGDATSVGWNIENALEMTPSTTAVATFVYQGSFKGGSFKFPVSRDNCFCQDFYTKDATDAGKMVYNKNGSGEDVQWQITEPGQYKITVDILKLTIKIEKLTAPPFSQLWIVGDASPSGWNIDSPKAFTQSASDPFIFSYEANLTAGSFKILAGATGDWNGNWYRPLTDGQALAQTAVAQNSGSVVDNKWNVTSAEAGRYKITLNTSNNTISIQKVNLYIVGDGGPNGWNIASPTAMTFANGVYTYSGPLVAGDFKIAKFKGDWCDGDWINAAHDSQAISDGSFIITHGCEGPDNKWKVKASDAGTHTITINLDTKVLTIN